MLRGNWLIFRAKIASKIQKKLAGFEIFLLIRPIFVADPLFFTA